MGDSHSSPTYSRQLLSSLPQIPPVLQGSPGSPATKHHWLCRVLSEVSKLRHHHPGPSSGPVDQPWAGLSHLSVLLCSSTSVFALLLER